MDRPVLGRPKMIPGEDSLQMLLSSWDILKLNNTEMITALGYDPKLDRLSMAQVLYDRCYEDLTVRNRTEAMVIDIDRKIRQLKEQRKARLVQSPL